jgi:hypothetical protein
MHGVPLTHQEVVNVVTRKVRGYEAIGLGHDGAVLMTATTFKTDPSKVADLVPPLPDDKAEGKS